MIQVLVILRYVITFLSVFMGFYYLTDQPWLSLQIVAAGMVGMVGILSFVTHVIFHKADAARLGWETDRPDWQFEVGFANLAFGLTAGLALILNWGKSALVTITVAYGIYLFQAALLHGLRAICMKPINLKKLFLSSFLTLIFVAFMLFFAMAGR